MGAKLRTWLGSWRGWVTLGCLVYIGLVRGRWSSIAAVWPWGLGIAQGLMLLALLFMGWIVSVALARYVFVPFYTFFQGKKIDDRTTKAKEKFADSLMSVSTAVFSAVLIGFLVFPFTLFIQTMAKGIDPVEALVSWWQSVGGSWMRAPGWSWWHSGLLFVLCWLPISVGVLFRKRALDIYDEIPPPFALQPTPAGDPTAQGAHERPSLPAWANTTHTGANGGSRRRRRPRAK